MGQEWDGFVPSVAVWDECFRVLKPGGHMAVFSGTRTFDLMAIGIRFAGFDIRDSLMWVTGSGFPKSLDVGKATGDPKWQGYGTALKPAVEPIVLARKSIQGTVAANVQEWGTGALNIDACRVGTDPGYSYPNGPGGTRRHDVGLEPGGRTTPVQSNPGGRFPANVVLDPDTAHALDQQSGFSKSPTSTGRGAGGQNGMYSPIGSQGRVPAPGNEGGASRFFTVVEPDPPFLYAGKAPKRERPNVDGVQHPTVKPLSVMRWLCKLITPPGGVVLDPFAGSGTTVEAALLEGMNPIGIEAHAPYLPLIHARIDRAAGTLPIGDAA